MAFVWWPSNDSWCRFFCFRRKGVDSACGNLFPDGVMRAGLLCRIACEICISDDIYEAAGEWINLIP